MAGLVLLRRCTKENDPQGRGYNNPVGIRARLLLRRPAAARSHALLALATRKDEMIVIAVASPGTRWYIADFHELPVGHISRR
jgi:hypothetical protein